MKQLIFIIALASAFMLKADYIYWMVDDNPITVNDWNGNPYSEKSTWTQANLYYNGDLIGSLDSTTWNTFKLTEAYAYSEFTSASGSGTFMLELIGDQYGQISGAESALGQYIFSSPMSVLPAAAFGQGATFAVPEPTSGLLFLLGGMLLGLKRRRMA